MFFLTRSVVCIGAVAFMALKPGGIAFGPGAASATRAAATRVVDLCVNVPRCAEAATNGLWPAPLSPRRSPVPAPPTFGAWADAAGGTDAPAIDTRALSPGRRCAGRAHGAARCAA